MEHSYAEDVRPLAESIIDALGLHHIDRFRLESVRSQARNLGVLLLKYTR